MAPDSERTRVRRADQNESALGAGEEAAKFLGSALETGRDLLEREKEFRKIFKEGNPGNTLDQREEATGSALEESESQTADPECGLDEDLDNPAFEEFQQSAG